MATRVVGVGAAVPDWRLPTSEVHRAWGRPRGRGSVAVCSPDEDTLTLAWEAATAALSAAGTDAEMIDGLWWGTTRPPFAEGPSHAFLAAGLGLSEHAQGTLSAGSPHAGIEAFFGAADAIAAGTVTIALVVASDGLQPGLGTASEAGTGAGAAAFVLAQEGGVAEITVRSTRSRPLLDRYRGDAERDTRDVYDARLFREEIFLPLAGTVAETLAATSPHAWSLPDPDGRLGPLLARSIAAENVRSREVREIIGDAGAASSLMGTVVALDTAGTVATVAYGGGRCSGFVIEAHDEVAGAATAHGTLGAAGHEVTYNEVLRARGQLEPSGEMIPMGVPPESALFARGNPEMMGALGGRCADCSTINTPPSIHPTCIACGSSKLEPVRLASEGEVHTFVINQTMPAPFVAPLPLAVIDLDDGARVMLQGVGRGDDVAIGARVRLVLRRYAHERGVPVYGMKARVVAAE